MRRFFLISMLLVSTSGFAQDEFMVWTKFGVKQKLVKKLSYDVEINTRFDRFGIATFFPQVGLSYKVKKWFKPSIEYRFIVDRNKYGNYKPSNRLNFNADFDKSFDRLTIGTRLRYQYAFDRVGASDSYNPDFDMAFRIKPNVEYDIDNFILTPQLSAEFFYNPQYGDPYSPGFSKMRIAVGADLDIKSPHGVGVKYQMDKWFNNYSKGLRHVIAISYSYKI